MTTARGSAMRAARAYVADVSIDTWVIARHSGSCCSSQAMTAAELRPVTCANRPPVPSKSTRPVSNRSTHTFTPVEVTTSYRPFPRRVSSRPSTRTGVGASGSTSSAYATNASCAIFQSIPNSSATPSTGRRWSPIDTPAARRARVVILARAGMSAGSASVNTFRSHSGTRQCHFRLCHNRIGRSGPIRTSRGRVVTRSFGDEDCCRHAGHQPANSGSVEQCTTLVQQLFAIGLAMQISRQLCGDRPELAARITGHMNDLQGMIQQIRNAVPAPLPVRPGSYAD